MNKKERRTILDNQGHMEVRLWGPYVADAGLLRWKLYKVPFSGRYKYLSKYSKKDLEFSYLKEKIDELKTKIHSIKSKNRVYKTELTDLGVIY